MNRIALAFFFLLLAAVNLHAQNTFCASNLPCTVTAPWNFTDGLFVNSLNVLTGNVEVASRFPGSDCGAKINAAESNFGSTPGEIWIDQNCGTSWTTAVVITNNGHTLVFIQGGLYSTSATITLAGNNDAITAPPQSMTPNTLSSGYGEQVVLQMTTGANLSSIITTTGNFPVIENINVDGNYSYNPSGGVNIKINGSARAEISRVTSGNAQTNGVEFDNAPSPKVFKLMTYQNRNDGLYCNGSSTGGGDGFVSNSEFEANQGNGIELSNCPAWRVVQNDFGQNSQGVSGSCGLTAYGTTTGGTVNAENINLNQFANNFRDDLCIVGYNSGNTSLSSTITGNIFLGSNNLLSSNTYNNVKFTDGGQDAIVGNVFSGNGNYACGISLNETSSGRAIPSATVPNIFTSQATWGTGAYCDNTANKASGLMLPPSATSGSVNRLLVSPVAPTVSSGFNTGSIGAATGTASFSVVVGSGTAGSTGVLSLPASTSGWYCIASNRARAAFIAQTADSTTSATLTNYGTTFAATNWTNGDAILISCFPRNN